MANFTSFDKTKISSISLYSLYGFDDFSSDLKWYYVDGRITEEDIKKLII